jgi:hypothetical protein
MRASVFGHLLAKINKGAHDKALFNTNRKTSANLLPQDFSKILVLNCASKA